MISGYIVGDVSLVAKIRAVPDAVHARVSRVVAALGTELVHKVQHDKLMGQVLHIRTGRLIRSIAQGGTGTRTRLEDKPDSILYYVGTNVEYGRRWELGYHGPESVRQFTRMQSMAWGRPIPPRPVTVRAFVRQINQRARPFLSPALDEMSQHIRDEIGKALSSAVQETLGK